MKEPSFRYIDRPEICVLRGCGRTKQIQDEKSGYFPPGERHGMRTVKWRSDVVAKWLEEPSAAQQVAPAEMLQRQVKSVAHGVEERKKKRAAARVQELAGQA